MTESNEYLIKKETLASIADEARTLSGITEEMSPEVIADTIHTENTNFRANISAQDNLIAQIQAALVGKAGGSTGSMLPNGVKKITTGTFTLTSDRTNQYTVNHELGVMPNFVFVIMKDAYISAGSHTDYLLFSSYYSNQEMIYNGGTYSVIGSVGIGTSTDYPIRTSAIQGYSGVITAYQFDVFANTDCKIKAGETYYWVAGVADNI